MYSELSFLELQEVTRKRSDLFETLKLTVDFNSMKYLFLCIYIIVR